MKLSDMETEPQARPVILAPPHSKWSYYLLMRKCGSISGKDGFNLNEPNAWNWKLLWMQLNLMETFPWIFLYKVHFHCSVWSFTKLRFDVCCRYSNSWALCLLFLRKPHMITRMCSPAIALEVIMTSGLGRAWLHYRFNGCEEEQIITEKPYTEGRRAGTKPEEKYRTHIKVEGILVWKSLFKRM